jgi:hypothetical protein
MAPKKKGTPCQCAKIKVCQQQPNQVKEQYKIEMLNSIRFVPVSDLEINKDYSDVKLVIFMYSNTSTHFF